MEWVEYINQIDDSHQMTTAKKHIKMLCDIVHGQSYKILEFGSHAGLSTAALALSSPTSSIDSIDLCDTIPQNSRVQYWSSLGINNITPFPCSSRIFLQKNTTRYDFIFHDALHGMGAMPEYLLCCDICDILAIHDFERITNDAQTTIISKFKRHIIDFDNIGRHLFIGFKK